jgi:metallophosphoesterase (TIGR03768 family)
MLASCPQRSPAGALPGKRMDTDFSPRPGVIPGTTRGYENTGGIVLTHGFTQKTPMKEEVRIGILVAGFFIAVIGGVFLLMNIGSPGGGYPINSTVYTTLDRTVIPVPVPPDSPVLYPYEVSRYAENGYGRWMFGEGLGYEKRLDLMPAGYSPAPVTHDARLLHFFSMSDIHIADKETPAQAIVFGYKGGNPSAYSPTALMTTQTLDAAIQTMNALHLKEPFDFGIGLGDAINSNQYNELRWYIDVMDGKTINPDSGAKDNPVSGPLNDYQDVYKAAGLNRTIPWYQTLGNHDQFWLGTFVPDKYIRQTMVGQDILNQGDALTDPLGIGSRGFYTGAIDGRTPYGDVIGAGPVSEFNATPRVPAADPNRRGLSRSEWMGEFFNSSTLPNGHGFSRAGAAEGFASYTFDPKSDIPIRVIVLDDTMRDTDANVTVFADASLDQARYDWLVSELEKGQAEGRLMIIAAHLPIRNESAASSKLWTPGSPVSERMLIERLQTYPNLLLWISGHVHRNTVTAFRSPDPNRPELGFWEVETASLRDFPQQLRTFEIVRNSDNTVSVFATDVDPSVRDGTPAALSRSYAVAALQLFNSSAVPGPSGAYNAELVKQLSPEMQEKIRHYGTPIAG